MVPRDWLCVLKDGGEVKSNLRKINLELAGIFRYRKTWGESSV